MSQILVTGGCGYIGSHVVKALSEAGEQVVVFDNLVHGRREALLHGETLVVGDITSPTSLASVFQQYDIDTVIHLAALVNAAESVQLRDEYLHVNAQGSANVWAAATAVGAKHLMYASSAAVYGTPDGPYAVDESHPVHPSNPYGEGKLAGETAMFDVALANSLNCLSFRFFNVGGAEPAGRLHQNPASRAILQRLFAVASGVDETLTISGHDYDTPDGTVVRDFIHVDDIALAFVLGLHYLRTGGKSAILNLGSGESHTLGELVKEVEVVTGKKIPVQYGPRIPGDISYSLADARLAEKVLGWEPVHTLRLIVRDGYNAYVQQNT